MTNEQDWVLDPFMGVGTTAIAALMHNRKAIGAEILLDYVKIAKERIKLAEKGKLRIRPMERNVYDPNGSNNNIPPKYVRLNSPSEHFNSLQPEQKHLFEEKEGVK